MVSEKKKPGNFIGRLCLWLTALCLPMQAWAKEASVVLGSQSYEVEQQQEFQIGLTVRCEEPDFIYRVALQYDAARMAYLGGADGAGDGILYFAGEESQGKRNYMLRFRALAEGESAVSVTEAAVITNPGQVSGNDPEKSPQEAQIAQLGSAVVRVSRAVECSLKELKIGQAPDFSFDPAVLAYEFRVGPEVETLEVEAVAQDERASVTVSGTGLQEGENTVEITVSGGDRTEKYTLSVIRESAAPALPETTAPEETVPPKEEGVVERAGEETVPAPAESAEGTEEETVRLMREETFPFWRPAAAVGGAAAVAAGVFGARAFRKKRRKGREEDCRAGKGDAGKEEDWLDPGEGDEADWFDLDDEEGWERWLEEVEEAMEESEPEAAAEEAAQGKPEEQVPVAIRVSDVSMNFRISDTNATSLKEYLLAAVKHQNKYHDLRALDHISFQVLKGEVVGIVGTNGSGKSTLLKLIAGAMKPSEGTIEVDRKKVQLLTLGTGFDSELTARENVYLNGAIIGYSREFIDRNFDRIVEFAELEGFMDEKIKNFSSGMVSRLGFAIATVRETPEILILDEVLSVGDMFFRKKSEKRIKELIHSGSTVLIVSHSTDTIIKNCTKAVWIEKGVLKAVGEPKQVCEAYKKMAG